MSGMKFRRTCTVCNATFFSPDRKAAYCLKCMKKRVVKHVPAEARVAATAPRVVPRPVPPPPAPPPMLRKAKPARAPKASTLTDELRERIMELFHNEFSNRAMQTKEMHSQTANRLWVKRQLVADVIRQQLQTQVTMT